MKLTIATLIAVAPLLVGSTHASSADLFSWLDSGKNTQIVQEVKKAFSFDLDTTKKARIQPKDSYYQWTFVKLASFEPSPTPDIIFSYFDCLECEKVELLSSFRFDPQEKRWKTRVWPENDPHLMIGSDNQLGEGVWMFRISKASSNSFWIYLPMGANLNEILVGSQEGCC
jgi:hypothetical protein